MESNTYDKIYSVECDNGYYLMTWKVVHETPERLGIIYYNDEPVDDIFIHIDKSVIDTFGGRWYSSREAAKRGIQACA